MPNFTDNKTDRAYESFMKQIPGFQRDPPEAREIQRNLERKQRKDRERNLDRALASQIPGGEADIRARITELTQQKQELVARCMEENDITKYELLLTKIVEELEQLNQRLGAIESQQKNRAITESRMAEINELLAQFAESGLEYDDILTRRLISTIHVKSADEIEITFKDGKTRTENLE